MHMMYCGCRVCQKVAFVVLLLWPAIVLPQRVHCSAAGTSSTICPVTKPNGNPPPGEAPSSLFYGNGTLWTALWPEGTVPFGANGPGSIGADGSLNMKFPWWRKSEQELKITGRRLDAPAPPLRANIGASTDVHMVPADIIFPTEGCWEVTGKAGTDTLTFVAHVVKVNTRENSPSMKATQSK